MLQGGQTRRAQRRLRRVPAARHLGRRAVLPRTGEGAHGVAEAAAGQPPVHRLSW